MTMQSHVTVKWEVLQTLMQSCLEFITTTFHKCHHHLLREVNQSFMHALCPACIQLQELLGT